MSSLAPSACPPDEKFALMSEGRLSTEQRQDLFHHANGCTECQMLLAWMAPEGSQRPHDTPFWTAEEWTPPPAFGGFELQERLGRGAMGVVYAANDQKLKRRVAVKFIAAEQPTQRAREHFQTEALAIARLQHPNVVTLYLVGEVEGHPYLVSELLDGQSLAALEPPLPWRRVLHIGLRAARGLAAAHQQGVLHRDIKPSNIFLTRQDEVKLLDFGLAELIDPEAPAGRSRAGTPRYMSPELRQGSPATLQSDLYALGLVLYGLCTGDPPPADSTPPALLTERMPEVDPDFAAILARCLHPAPAQRYPSADALCAALEQLMAPPGAAGNPYRGLEPFEAEHQALFFGRDEEVQAVLERLRQQSLVLVAGDSGVGKSSLCRAGVVPRARKELDPNRAFLTLRLEPGRRPLDALAAALAPRLGRAEAELATTLAADPVGGARLLRDQFARGQGLLLFVDQLEEVLTQSERAQAEGFARLLGELALPVETGVRVLLAMRGDFLTRLWTLPGLDDVEVERALYVLRPLRPENVRDAIVRPAGQRGVDFESEALLRELIAVTGRDAGGLPLLQFALTELWERRDLARSLIPRDALEALGGVGGALSRHADGVLQGLSRAGREQALRMLEQLVTPAGTRRERGEAELDAATDEARPALRALIEGRLVHVRTASGQTAYELAHEALISHWGTLRDRLDEHKGQRALRHRLEVAGQEWERLGRTEELLWRERQLDEARALEPASLGVREQDFLRISRRTALMRKWQRWMIAPLVLLMVLAGYGALRYERYRQEQQELEQMVGTLRSELSLLRDEAAEASVLRARAVQAFSHQEPEDRRRLALQDKELAQELAEQSRKRWLRAEEEWSLARKAFDKTNARLTRQALALEDVLALAPSRARARSLLVEFLTEQLRLTEDFHAPQEELLARIRRLSTDTGQEGWVDQPAQLEFDALPPGTRIEVARSVQDEQGRYQFVLEKGFFDSTRQGPLDLAPGAYLLRILRDGQPLVNWPLRLGRGEHKQVALAQLRLPSHIPDGTVYVPPSCFIRGTNAPEREREFMHNAPMHEVCIPHGYFIGRHEVTFGDWVDYLEANPLDRAARQLFKGPVNPNSPYLEFALNEVASAAKRQQDAWRFTLKLQSGALSESDEEGRVSYGHRTVAWRQLPLQNISLDQLSGFFHWLDRSGKLPGARLCEELEWTLAARGPDTRQYPHGDVIVKGEANFDLTYDRAPSDFGPDAVGSHPASRSPFGLDDMAGNAFEMTLPMQHDLGDLTLMGGAWYYERASLDVSNRQVFAPQFNDTRVGLRLCASAPSASDPAGKVP